MFTFFSQIFFSFWGHIQWSSRLERPDGVPGIKSDLTTCKKSTLPTVLLLQALSLHFSIIFLCLGTVIYKVVQSLNFRYIIFQKLLFHYQLTCLKYLYFSSHSFPFILGIQEWFNLCKWINVYTPSIKGNIKPYIMWANTEKAFNEKKFAFMI